MAVPADLLRPGGDELVEREVLTSLLKIHPVSRTTSSAEGWSSDARPAGPPGGAAAPAGSAIGAAAEDPSDGIPGSHVRPIGTGQGEPNPEKSAWLDERPGIDWGR